MGIATAASGSRGAERDHAPPKAKGVNDVNQAPNLAKGSNDKGAAPAQKAGQSSADSHVETIEVSGRATDSAGRPVSGATAYVIETNRRSMHPIFRAANL